MSNNSYILRRSSKNIWLGIYSVWLVAIDTYPEVVMKLYFLLLLRECNCVQIR